MTSGKGQPPRPHGGNNPLPPHLSGGANQTPKPSSSPPLPPHLAGSAADEEPKTNAQEDQPRRKLPTNSAKGTWLATLLFGMFAFLIFGGFIMVLLIQRPDLLNPNSPESVEHDLGRKVIRITPDVTPTWADASKVSLRRNRVKVRIDRVEVGNVRIKNVDGTVMISDDANYILIAINVFNHAPKPVEYRSWYGNPFQTRQGRRTASLSDLQGKKFKLANFPEAASVRDHTPQAIIEPLSEVNDMIIFEAPKNFSRQQFRTLRLELPAEAYSEQGDYRFEIPRSFVTTLPEPMRL